MLKYPSLFALVLNLSTPNNAAIANKPLLTKSLLFSPCKLGAIGIIPQEIRTSGVPRLP